MTAGTHDGVGMLRKGWALLKLPLATYMGVETEASKRRVTRVRLGGALFHDDVRTLKLGGIGAAEE